jgi:hypothetical protein
MDGPDTWKENNIVAWVILGYLCSYPDAKDTEGGVRKWWLGSEGIDVDTDVVRDSLDYLVKWGWLTSTGGYAGLAVYGLNKSRHYALRGFLQSHSNYY